MQLTDGEDLQNAVLCAPIGICILNATTLIAEIVNDKFLEVAGKPYGAIHGQFYWDAFAEARPYYEGALTGVVRTGEAYYADEVELMLIRHGREEIIFVTFVYSPVKDKAGKVSKVAVWVLENTKQVEERQRVETTRAIVQKERDHLTRFFMQAPAGICVLKGPDLVFELVNPTYQRLLPGRKLLGRPIFEALPELVGQELQKVMMNVYRTGEPYEINELLIPVAEQEGGPTRNRYFSFNYQARRDENDEVDGILVFVFEVTDVVNARQDQLAQTEEFQAVNEEYVAINEELTATNEELSSVNEELYASNEELIETQEYLRDTNLALEASELRLKIAFEDVARSEKLFRSIALNIPKSLIIVIGKDHRYITIEGEIMERLGYDRKNYEGKHPLEVGPAERYKASRELYERVLAGETFSVERKAATGENFMVHFVPLKNEQDEVEAGLIIALDITMIKQAEEKSAKLAAIIESSDDAIIGKTLDSVITSWNDSAERIFGYTADEIIGQTVYTLIPSDRYEEEPRILAQLKNGQRVEHFETKRLTKDGRELDVSLTISPILDSQGNIIGLSKIMRDITERKQAEEKSAKLAAIIESSDDAIIGKTLDSVITSWNDSAERIFGYTADEIIGQTVYTLIPSDRYEEEPRILAQLKNGQRVEHFETKRLTKDGRELDVSLTISPILDSQGNIIGLSKIMRDITERKQDETRKNDFIGMASHELKTPLTSLNAIIQVVNSKLKNSEDTFLVSAMDKANMQVKRMTAMINGFLNISRFEAGKIQIDKQPFKLAELLQEIVDESRLVVNTHTILLADCGLIEINADRDKISSVVSNLVSNAIKYSPKGKFVELACKESGGKVIVSIKDEGMGIKARDLSHIFDRYYRVETNHTKHISGFGIGLYLSSEIIKRHDGEIWAESESGIGSTFYFSLPLKEN